ncbi:MAG: S1C family serine protease [Propionibacteriaceae bacterium]|nr:S1C family serine protease [Propionibacteriaceae bacterium]
MLHAKWGFAVMAVAVAVTALTAPAFARADDGNENGGVIGTIHTGVQPDTTTQPKDLSDGLVLIKTVVGYGDGVAAGTGLVLTSNGIVITNHHVVAGSTAVTVTDPANGKKYDADVLGYDSTRDVAVLQLVGASKLPTITVSTQPVISGESITAIGNAEGGGQLVTVTGEVTQTAMTVTVTEQNSPGKSTLTNLVGTTAPLVPGDSGGAMFDNSSRVIAMNVAGSTNSHRPAGYGIPIVTALKVANAVVTGQPNSTVTLGRTGGLGVVVSTQSNGALKVTQVVSGGPAAKAGMTGGSTITTIDGVEVSSSDQLSSILATHQPGDKVQAGWKDRNGRSHTATVTLGVAPLA